MRPAPKRPHPPLPRAVLLDLDDTILDDSGSASRCWLEACEAHAGELGGIAPERLFEAIERTRGWYWADRERHRAGRLDLGAARAEVVGLALAELGVGVGVAATALAGPGLPASGAPGPLDAKIAAEYGRRRDTGMRPLDDAIETVRWLREQGCLLALVTNGNGAAQRAKVDRFQLAALFEVILIEGELGFGKPDPRIYRRALDELGVEASDVWMVGDNLEWEVASPQRLGIFSVWVDVHGAGLPTDHPVQPDRIVRRLADLRGPA
jgi:putative hydrolase of the HAD superfamily